jgi:hypothetical protein
MRSTAPILSAALAAAALLAGCGGGKTDTGASTTTPASSVTTVTARLTGAAALPKGPPSAAGTASITLNPKAGKACWKLSVSGIDEPLSAHIHEAAVGKLGPVVIPLGDTFSERGCVLAPRRALKAVAATPADYYIDVHTTKHLPGAVRGQLRAAAS